MAYPSTAVLDLSWLRRGFAAFLWNSSRSLASLHQRAARLVADRFAPARLNEGGHFQLAGSFIQYLFERQGNQRLRAFFNRADAVGVDRAARVTFGKSFTELEVDWKSMLERLPR